MEPNTPIELPATVDPGPPGRDWSADAQCLQCGYALRGLISNRCPECGKPFDRYDRNTLRLPKHLRPRKPIRPPTLPGSLVFALLLFCFVAILMVYARFDREEFHLLFALVSGGTGVLLWVGYEIINWSWPGDTFRSASLRQWRIHSAIMLILIVLVSASSDKCPHARYYGFGPMIFVTQNIDPQGPCHNRRDMRPILLPFWR